MIGFKVEVHGSDGRVEDYREPEFTFVDRLSEMREKYFSNIHSSSTPI